MVLQTNFKAFKVVSSEKKIFQKFEIFWLFCISWVTDFLKNDQLLFWEIPAWNLLWTAQMVLLTNFKAFKVVSCEKNFFQKLEIFWLFFAYPGSQISWKMTNFFFERYRPEICRGLHKWCCERILRRFGSFWAKKKFFEGSQFFNFFAYPGSQISWKMTNFFFERYRPEIFCGLQKWCCERIIRRFWSFRAKKNFFKNLKFFDFFCISGVTDFLKNDQLLFWEIPAWNFSWTAQMVLRTNHKVFWLVSSEKKIFQKFEIFWLFLHIRGHRFLEKWPTSFLRDTGLKFFVDYRNGVANEL